MPYAKLEDVRGQQGALVQFYDRVSGNVDTSQDPLFQQLLDDTTAIINARLAIGADLTAAAVGSVTLYGDGTPFLWVPLCVPGSVVGVFSAGDVRIDHWIEVPNGVRMTGADGSLWSAPTAPPWAYGPTGASPYGLVTPAFAPGVPYSVQASFGASAYDLGVLRRINVELTVQYWRFRDAGGSLQVGTDQAVVNVKNALSPISESQLALLHDRIHPKAVVM